jgi:hypothetical protein
MTRFWLALFFLGVRLQARFGFAPSHRAPDRPGSDATPAIISTDLHR